MKMQIKIKIKLVKSNSVNISLHPGAGPYFGDIGE